MAGSHGLAFAEAYLKLWFQGVAVPNLADNAASSPLTDLFVSLHVASPAAGDQSTNECTYTSYARVNVARSGAGWDVSGTDVQPMSDIVFPTCTGGAEIATWFGIGTVSSGAGVLMYCGPLSPTITIANTVTPKIKAASTISEN